MFEQVAPLVFLLVILPLLGKYLDYEQDKVHHEIHQDEQERIFLTKHNHL